MYEVVLLGEGFFQPPVNNNTSRRLRTRHRRENKGRGPSPAWQRMVKNEIPVETNKTERSGRRQPVKLLRRRDAVGEPV